MTAKSKRAHPFKLGDRAIVRATDRDGHIADTGTIVAVGPLRITFQSELKGNLKFRFRRKGTEWVELKKDHYRLEAP